MVIVNPLTSQILKHHEGTSFGNYFDWRGKDTNDKLLEIRAIEFPNDEAYFLAGPLRFQDKSYGMAYFQYDPKAPPRAEQEAKQIEDMKRIKDLSWAPYALRTKYCKYLDPHAKTPHSAGTEIFYDPETKRHFSGLDLRFGGAGEIGNKVITRAKKRARQKGAPQICTAFWTTDIATKRICEYMGKEDVDIILAAQAEKALRFNEEDRYIVFCKERPYQIYLMGTDDTSFTKTFETEEKMYKFADRMKQLGADFVMSNMTFTN